jgi:hypothetical protein
LKKPTILALLILSVFVCGLQMASPVAAVKVIDHGSNSYYDDFSNSTTTNTWKTYQYSANYIIVKMKSYQKSKIAYTMTLTIKKVSSKKLKLVSVMKASTKNPDGLMSYYYSKSTDYMKYSPNARKFYYNEIRPGLLEDPLVSVLNS